MRVNWPMKSREMWNKSKIILACAEKKHLPNLTSSIHNSGFEVHRIPTPKVVVF